MSTAQFFVLFVCFFLFSTLEQLILTTITSSYLIVPAPPSLEDISALNVPWERSFLADRKNFLRAIGTTDPNAATPGVFISFCLITFASPLRFLNLTENNWFRGFRTLNGGNSCCFPYPTPSPLSATTAFNILNYIVN